MAVIKDLPSELLLQAFLQACRGDYDSWCVITSNRPSSHTRGLQSGEDADTFVYAWIYVTHVCRLWRNIALSYPGLWNISWTDSASARDLEFLRRSKDLSLSISMVWVRQYLEVRTTRLYFAHLEDGRRRVESLLIDGASDTLLKFALAAPSLRKLHFSSSRALEEFFSGPMKNIPVRLSSLADFRLTEVETLEISTANIDPP